MNRNPRPVIIRLTFIIGEARLWVFLIGCRTRVTVKMVLRVFGLRWIPRLSRLFILNFPSLVVTFGWFRTTHVQNRRRRLSVIVLVMVMVQFMPVLLIIAFKI